MTMRTDAIIKAEEETAVATETEYVTEVATEQESLAVIEKNDQEASIEEADETDPLKKIKSIDDCLNYLSKEKPELDPRALSEQVIEILDDFYDEIGSLCLRGAPGNYYLVVIEENGVWNSYDPSRCVRYGKNGTPSYHGNSLDKLMEAVMVNREYLNYDTVEYTKSTDMVFPDNNAPQAKAPQAKAPQVVSHILNQTEYTDEELLAFIATNPSLSDAADKLHTAKDAMRFLKLSGYHYDYSFNPCREINGRGWSWVLSAEFTYAHMAGSCGGTSNLMNRLLAGDYDEQGYVRYFGGHIFNYIKTGDTYHICDFMRGVDHWETGEMFNWYYIGSYTDPSIIAESYGNIVFPGQWNDQNNKEQYLYCMYMYPRNGKNALPVSESNRKFTVAPKSIEDSIIILHLEDGLSMTFVDIDGDAEYPPENDIPDDEHFDFRTGQRK